MMIPLVGQSYELSQKSLSSQRTINWIIKNLNDMGVKSKTILQPTQGAEIAYTVNNSSLDCRGLYYASSGPKPDLLPRLYGVWGEFVYRFNESLSAAYEIGTVGGTLPVRMSDNGFRLTIADGTNLWEYPLDAVDGGSDILTISNLPPIAGLTPVSNVQPSHVAFLGERVIVNCVSTNQWYFSGLPVQNSALTWGAADFFSSTTDSGATMALAVNNGSLWIFGYRYTEIWRPNDNQDQPYSYVQGSQQAIGIVAPQSVATINNLIFWLGGSDVGASGVFLGQSISMTRISTPAIEDQIQQIQDQSQAIGWAYCWGGYTFYVLSFPNDNRTFVYEASTGTWTERMMRDIATSEWLVSPYQFGVIANGQLYTGLIGGNPSCLVHMSDDIFTEFDGRQVVRVRVSQPYWDTLNFIQARELVVDMETGTTGLLSGYGYDPQIQLEISKDGGYTYGKALTKSIGQQGDYKKHVRFFGLGRARNMVFRITVTTPNSCSIYQARLDYAVCSRT